MVRPRNALLLPIRQRVVGSIALGVAYHDSNHKRYKSNICGCIIMRWIYILRCENDVYYVGQTERLYRRFWEHTEGRGGLNTSIHTPECIVALYKVDTLCSFFEYNMNVVDTINHKQDYMFCMLKNFNESDISIEYDKLNAENDIAECLMTHNGKKWNNIRGGKYVRFDIDYTFPVNEYVKHMPLCKCGLPCDVKKNEDKNFLFFRCAKKNMWDDFREQFEIEEEPCNFYMEYVVDIEYRLESQNRKKTLHGLFKKSHWLNNVEINDETDPQLCIGGCCRTSQSIKLTYLGEKRNLCFDCFIDKNEELSKKYHNKGVCLIPLTSLL